ncbi:MAG: CPBP family intramembrane metalloprotease [Candidatus Bathyarchaeota archaeon]|nr:CPBP family intramembrane metalloprotease [Candidatus Bathyarchaeota archaeon]
MVSTKASYGRAPLYIAWAATLTASTLTLIPWRELLGGEPGWWWGATAIVIISLFTSTLLVESLRPVRGYIIIISLIFFLGLGGGWQTGLVPLIRRSQLWIASVENAPWAVSALATHFLKLVIPLTILGYLLARGRSLRDIYLVKWDVSAMAESSRLIGMKKPEPWTHVGLIFTVIFSTGTVAFVLLSARPSLDVLIRVLPLVPVAIVIAGINSFNEEFTLRAAPLSELVSAVGKEQALLMTTVFFGLGHFYGIPPNLIGVALAGFLGWFLGKSILETRGFFWAWFIHFVQDIFVFTFLAMAVI